jgi:hypothetical protein
LVIGPNGKMRIPKESLEDFASRSADRKPADPPPVFLLRSSGKVKLLKPLTSAEDLARAKALAAGPWVRRLSWFHRSLVITGAVAMIAFLVSTIYIGLYGPTGEFASRSNDAAASRKRKGPVPPKDPGLFRSKPESQPPVMIDEQPAPARSIARSSHSRPRVELAVYRQRHAASRRSKFVMSKFVPTTLVIYAENGQIKTRIEPQLTAGYKKPSTFPN